ncbi:DUF805 domain-containing protein [Vibrio fluvialis]|jgi:uncharacterized membrane protein YhaH (DUF805 family)|uniref:Membrane protein n=1 Tax=Vibrio fluvialis PG41 TaxID=1336752 RepID=S7I5G9_VIBFL|nr:MULTISPECIES: DUF805 domain-containing protein [Vibrio]TNF19799.1 MAG: DUF805 domain-containing protein [Vibrionaceae bacterium]HDM8034449.1 DUF805 domain-containing protein [Vibrio fluvialis clinical-1]EKO3373980.1 DUF805 domain-containing protein [Vibrio fluvialis]EKO3377296.1 DUF805 domain-containing protein [Vibrio fluvialis]EKO3381248.1 DUF805 domain-containing protein [Vibrio fluvialis]
MSYQTLLFSFQGRIGRQTYWIWNVCYYLAIVSVIVLLNRWLPGLAPYVLPLFMLLILVPDLAVTAKRWHDRDKSSWWLLLNVPLVIGRMTVPMGEASMTTTPNLLDTGISLAALLCGSWILIECGFLAGSDGDNRFGKAPE